MPVASEVVGDVDDLLDQLAATYQQVRHLQGLGRNEEGLTLGLALLESAGRVLGPGHPEVAEVHATVGILARRARRRDLAVKHQRRALEIRIACFGDRDLSVAASLSNLGAVYLDERNFREAESCYRQALAIKEQSPDTDPLSLAFTRNNLASALSASGDNAQSEQLLLQAVAEADRAEAADSRSVEILSNLARIYRSSNRPADAIPVIERALEVGRQALPPGHYLLLEQHKLLAEACLQSGSFDNAEDAAQRVLDNAEPRSLHYASALNMLATIHRQMGRLSRATSEYEEAARVLNECADQDDPLLGVVLGNLAALFRQQREYAAARSLFERAVTILRTARHEMLALALNNYGVLALELGDHAKAEQLWRESIDLYNSRPYPNRDAKLAILLHNVGEMLSDQRRFTEAEPLLREANERKLQLLGRAHPERITGLVSLARVYIVTGRLEEGLRLLTEAGTLEEQTLWQVFARSGISERREAMDRLLAHYDAVLTAAVVYLGDSDEAATAAFERVLRGKALSAETVLAQYRAATGAKGQRILEQLFEVSSELSRAALAGGGTDSDAIAAWQAEQDRLEAQLAQETAGGGLAARLSIASADAVAAALPVAGVLVEYVRFQERNFEFPTRSQQAWGTERYAAFVLSWGDARVQMVDLGPAAPIDDLLSAFRQAVARGGEGVFGIERGADQDEAEELGVRLREVVFDPVAAHFPAAAESPRPLIIAPDGSLAKLPFAALPIGPAAVLLDDYVISYLPAGRKLLDRPPAGQAGPALVIAGPDFDLGLAEPNPGDRGGYLDDGFDHGGFDDGGFPPLPASRAEGALVADLLGVRPFLGAAATGELLTSARSPRIVHVATHAFFVPGDSSYRFAPGAGRLEVHPDLDPDAASWGFMIKEQDGSSSARSGVIHPGPLGHLGREEALYRSGLVFSGANAWLRKEPMAIAADTAVLTADRIACLDLSATELMVLSACETGLGEIRREEGVLGLRWACAVSGARSVLMSLWKVPDDETRQLMEGFYRDVLNGMPRAEALRAAQMSLRAARQDPFYWAAFVLEGDVGLLV
jgi:CHAT domain-containing protein/tetratricopeptide (TPR) repeat protein